MAKSCKFRSNELQLSISLVLVAMKKICAASLQLQFAEVYFLNRVCVGFVIYFLAEGAQFCKSRYQINLNQRQYIISILAKHLEKKQNKTMQAWNAQYTS